MDQNASNTARVGISACLLGRHVRYDGRDKRDTLIIEQLGQHFQWLPVCPEVELGLPVPRNRIQLELHGEETRLIMPATGDDLTAAMRSHAAARIDRLVEENIAGYIFKARSPSCGIEGVELWLPSGECTKGGVGLFAAMLRERLPDLPIEQDDRLHDPLPRERWLQRVLARRRG